MIPVAGSFGDWTEREPVDRRKAEPRTVPRASSAAAQTRMSANRRRDTGPELALRSELHRRGLRFRVDYPLLLRRRADLAFVGVQVAVFVDGCFWHGCPVHGTAAKANAAFWSAKIARNRARDSDTTRRLEGAGWHVVRVWEHEAVLTAATRIEDVVRARRTVAGGRPGRSK